MYNIQIASELYLVYLFPIYAANEDMYQINYVYKVMVAICLIATKRRFFVHFFTVCKSV